MIRIRGVPITVVDAREIAQRLQGDEAAAEFHGRLTRALADDGGLIATNGIETRALLAVVDSMLAEKPSYERLLELRGVLARELTV